MTMSMNIDVLMHVIMRRIMHVMMMITMITIMDLVMLITTAVVTDDASELSGLQHEADLRMTWSSKFPKTTLQWRRGDDDVAFPRNLEILTIRG